ncbi:hypothetical protein [Streptomyces sp. P17]|uniref:hypothetical protein n=1 Tax=Streptomyces sp. P17 TaxID=3074716 RepID=UPI0028F42B89|nr:hypothetical protein [Streptomyces sp. P17]MDT9694586.1 hypothetical protein [Streptomyces sp. P17]
MSRTVHHVPTRHRTGPPYWPHGTTGPCTVHSLAELRYSRQELSRARREGRRPRPKAVLRSFAAYTYPRGLGQRWTSPYESMARAELRSFRTTALKHLRAAPAGTLGTVAEALDHPPTRHRHRDLWEA